MPEMKTLNGYEVVDAKARKDIEDIKDTVESLVIPDVPDLSGYATETYVDNAIDNIVFPETDLSKHALKSEIPTKVSQLQNDSKFITREEVPETDLSEYAKKSELPTVPKKVSELTNDTGYITLSEVPKTDLSDYAKKSEIPDVSDFITNIPDEYITESELNAKGYLTEHQDISGKADKVHSHPEYLTEHQDISHLAPKSSIPTKVSQLANDSNYLTSIPSTYITEAELEAKNYLTEHQSLAAYATKTYVDNTVAENQPNLTAYAKKSDIPDVSGFISEIPSEYITDSELAAKKYATERYVGEAIAQAQLGGEDVDLSEYAKKTDVPTKTSQLTNDSNFLTAVPAEYVTETELDNKGYLTEHQSLDGKADKVHEHTEYANKTHNHSMADITDYEAPEIPSLDGYATEKYVDDAIAGIEIPEGSDVDLSNYVDLTSDQTVGGSKKFSKTVQVGTSSANAQLSTNELRFKNASHEDKGLYTSSNGLTFRWYKTCSETAPAEFSPCYTTWYNLGGADRKWGTLFAQKLSDGTTTKTMAEVLAGGSGTDLTGYATEDYVDNKTETNAAAITALVTRVAANESDIAAIEDREATYASKTSVTDCETAISNLTTRVTNLDGSGMRINTLEAEVAAIESTYVTMNDFPVMTESQYNALSSKDSNKFYFIKES